MDNEIRHVDRIVEFNTAVIAKEKGFNMVQTLYEYHTSGKLINDRDFIPHDYNIRGLISAPTQSQVQSWLRSEHGIVIISYPCYWGKDDIRNGMWEVKLYFMDDVEHEGTKEHDFNDVGYTTKFLECDDPDSEDWLMHNMYDTYEDGIEAALVYALNKIK